MSRNAPPKGKEREQIGSLRGYGDCCNQNVTSKLDLALGLVFCDYSMLVTLYEIGEASRPFTCIGTNGFHVKAENERFTSTSPRCRQNLNMKIQHRRLADYVKKLHQRACRTCSTIIFIFAHFWCEWSVKFPIFSKILCFNYFEIHVINQMNQKYKIWPALPVFHFLWVQQVSQRTYYYQ